MQIPEAPIGLRERKREETRMRLERAAVDIALADGIEHATVDAISAAANVSPRTFFNYFASKEDAILGSRDPAIATAAIERQIEDHTDGDVITSVMALMTAAMGSRLPDHGMQKSRMKLAKKYPELLTRQLDQFATVSEQLIGAVETILSANDRFADQTPEERRTSAELVLTICGGAMRVTLKNWMTAGGRGSQDEIQARAISLVKDTKERLS
jgi:AcrR family transcriptional regulator